MKKHRWVVPTTLLVSVGMVAAACGGDNKSSGGAAATTTASTAAATASTAAAGAATTAGGATTSAGSTQEGPVIPAAGSGKYGQDPNNKNLYVGPSGFQIDTTKCPSDWNINQGITNSEIDLFAS